MKSRRMQLALAVTMSSMLALSACAGGTNGGTTPGDGSTAGDVEGAGDGVVADNPQDRDSVADGGVLNHPLDTFPTNFNGSHVDGNLGEWSRVTNATDPSFYLYSPEGEIEPRTEFLQEMPDVSEEDGKQVIRYTLNPEAVWNDGTPIDYTAFQATWQALRQSVDEGGYNNISTTGYENVESVEQGEQPNEVVVTMAEPFYPVTQFFSGVIHPTLGESADNFNDLMKSDVRADLRSGPFTFESLDTTAQTIVLVPNPTWWGETPKLEQVVFRQMEDSASIPAFRNGEIDLVKTYTNSRMQEVAGAQGLEMRQSPRLVRRVFVYNSEATALSDVEVRKALWQGMNVDELKTVQYSGMDYEEDAVGSVMYFNFQEEYEDNLPVEFDVEGAKATLEGAGYTMNANNVFEKDGQPLTVRYTAFGDDPIVTALAQTIQTQMQAIGVDLQLDIRSSAQFGETMEQRTFDFLGMAWGSTSPAPVTSLCQLYCSDSSSNYAQVGTPELDERMRQIGSFEDAAEQAAEINALEKEWMQEYGQRPWTYGPELWGFREGLANYGPAAYRWITPKWENVGWQTGYER
ncbi:MAG: ABC transporter family substrate-binding protein [Mobilicoccus sp.]|nr:ABC transporter family substrate-binding protein [Mobilicoccus sp.]